MTTITIIKQHLGGRRHLPQRNEFSEMNGKVPVDGQTGRVFPQDLR